MTVERDDEDPSDAILSGRPSAEPVSEGVDTPEGHGVPEGVGAERGSPAVCKFPGCRAPRRPRTNRRGAPPAYCSEPSHEPGAARRERRRRLRLRLPLDAVLDHDDRPVVDPSGSSDLGEVELIDTTSHTSQRDDVAPASEPVGDARSEGEAPTVGPLVPVPRRGDAALAASRPPPGASTEDSSARARRVATQLALAAEATEQLVDDLRALEAENAELRERLQRAEVGARPRDV